jgi:hypothetical protein
MKIVPICGGLGAQIFGVILIDYLRSLESKDKIYADASYFQQQPKRASLGEGISLFPWELNYYGLPIDQYDDELPGKPGWLSRILRPHSFPKREEDGTVERLSSLCRALRNDWSEKFPIHAEHQVNAMSLLNKGGLATAVVHLRRGDYLNVASHVVTDSEVLPLLDKLRILGISRFLFVSDDPVPTDFFNDKMSGNIHIESVQPGDVFLAHALMRLTKCLVTSNSQFSLSAAVLNPNGVSFMPRLWFKGENTDLNQGFNRMTDWSILGM